MAVNGETSNLSYAVNYIYDDCPFKKPRKLQFIVILYHLVLC